MIKTICDKCGGEYNDNKLGFAMTISYGENYDLCNRCVKLFKKFMHGGEKQIKWNTILQEDK